MDAEGKKKLIYKVVLSGGEDLGPRVTDITFWFSFLGPCAGKTTTVARLRIFFENIGWKVWLNRLRWSR